MKQTPTNMDREVISPPAVQIKTETQMSEEVLTIPTTTDPFQNIYGQVIPMANYGQNGIPYYFVYWNANM